MLTKRNGSDWFPFLLLPTAAYKHADGRKIDGRRVLVDVERGRTVKGWRPRRLGEWVFLTSVGLGFLKLW